MIETLLEVPFHLQVQDAHLLLDFYAAALIHDHHVFNMFPFLVYEGGLSLQQLADHFYVLLSPLYIPVSDAAGVEFVEVAQDLVYPLGEGRWVLLGRHHVGRYHVLGGFLKGGVEH